MINITINITIWPYTERARAVSRGQFSQKTAIFLGKLANTNLVCANINSVCASWASCSEVEFFTTFLGKLNFNSPKKVILFWGNFFSSQLIFTKQMQYGRSGLVGGSVPPCPLSLGRSFSWVWTCVFWIWCAYAEFAEANFAKKCHNFGTFTPSLTS